LNIGEHKIELANSFNYLGPCITEDNNEYVETQRRLKIANIYAYCLLQAIMKNQDIHRKTKIRIYKTLIKTVLTFGCKTWTLSKKSVNAITISGRKIPRQVYGLVEENGQMEDHIQ
jgi:hypothetical protein